MTKDMRVRFGTSIYRSALWTWPMPYAYGLWPYSVWSCARNKINKSHL